MALPLPLPLPSNHVLGKKNLPDWESMWEILQREEMQRDLIKCQLEGDNSSGSMIKKEEEENAALASKGKQEKLIKKKDMSNIKCFRCGEMGHYTIQCPLKKDKDEKHDPHAGATKIQEDDCAMMADIPP